MQLVLKAKASWDSTKLLITKWQIERHELLILYHDLLMNYSDKKNHYLIHENKLSQFCQLLTDYISFGHFKIFECMAEVLSHTNKEELDANQQLLVKILRNTLKSLDFSEKYATNKNLVDFKNDFSELGESLANRFDWEDALVRSYKFHTT